MSEISINLADASIRQLLNLLADRRVTATQIMEAVAERIERRNGGSPSFDGAPDVVNAWEPDLDVEGALSRAAEIDRELEQGSFPPLAGIPIGVKSMIAVAGRPLTASSRVLEGNVAERDSAVWAALQAAGAVFVGHTQSHEFAAGGTTDQVGNPWDLSRTVGGSSGGSAAAIAAGMVPATLGTDTAGSLRIPAALTGVSTFKASYGRVPIDGVVPLSATLDHVGPIARTIDDCALLLRVLSVAPRGRDPWGVAGRPMIEEIPRRDLSGVRIALTDRTKDAPLDEDVKLALQRAQDAAVALGAELVELAAPPAFSVSDYDTILIAETRSYHERYRDRAELYRDSTRQFIAPGAKPIPVRDYLAAQGRRINATAVWQRWFEENRIDAILEPTSAIVAHPRGSGYETSSKIGGTHLLTYFTATWNVTGFPVASLPVDLGEQRGLPVGVSLIARSHDDDRLLGIGSALQRLLPPPRLDTLG